MIDYLVRIEYKQKGGSFHFEKPTEPNRNTNGYFTIYPHISRQIAGEFTDYLWEKYDAFLNEDSKDDYPTVEVVKQEFEDFCKRKKLL